MREIWMNNSAFIRNALILLGVYLVLHFFFQMRWNSVSADLAEESKISANKVEELYPESGTDIERALQKARAQTAVLLKRKKAIQSETLFEPAEEFTLSKDESRPSIYFKKIFANKYGDLRQYAATRNIDIPPELGMNVADLTDNRGKIAGSLQELAIIIYVCYAAIESGFREIPGIQVLPEIQSGSRELSDFITETRFKFHFRGTPQSLVRFLAITGKPGKFLYVRTLDVRNRIPTPAQMGKSGQMIRKNKDRLLNIHLELSALSYMDSSRVVLQPDAGQDSGTEKEPEPKKIITGYR